MAKIKIVRHKLTGLVLHNGKWKDFENSLDVELYSSIEDIEYKGQYSEDIIDTNYFSPENFGKKEWDEEDDLIDDYEEVEIEIKDKYIVEYHNFYPDYSLKGHKGGYLFERKSFQTKKEAEIFVNSLDDNYRGSIL